MIRHEQAQAAMPDKLLVVVFHRWQHRVTGAATAQLIFPRRHAFNGDEKPTAVGNPLWNRVRKFFADRGKGWAGSPLPAICVSEWRRAQECAPCPARPFVLR